MALILHPLRRTNWLEKQWSVERAKIAIWNAQKLWEKFRDLPLLFNSASSYNQESQLSQRKLTDKEKKRQNSAFEQIRQKRVLESRPRSLDEYEDYCQEASYDPGIPPLQWWLQPMQIKRWPRLSALAIEILSIPAMSAEPERIFSGGRHTMRWDRGKLSMKTLEMLECQKNWKGQIFPQAIADI
jgi:hypothetical protein